MYDNTSMYVSACNSWFEWVLDATFLCLRRREFNNKKSWRISNERKLFPVKKTTTTTQKQRNKRNLHIQSDLLLFRLVSYIHVKRLCWGGVVEIKCWKVTTQLQVIGDFHMASISLSFVYHAYRNEKHDTFCGIFSILASNTACYWIT